MSSFRELEASLPRRGRPGAAKRPPIVVIDDDPLICESLEIEFSASYQLTLCNSAQAGVNAVSEETCAVILDVVMPGQDGFWACSEIHRRFPEIPVIFYSAYQSAKSPFDIINECRPFGYIFKGADIDGLVHVVNTAVKLQTMMVANRKLIQELKKSKRREP